MSAVFAYKSSVGEYPQVTVPVCIRLIDPLPGEGGILMVVKDVAVEAVESVGSAEPDITVLFLIYAVDC